MTNLATAVQCYEHRSAPVRPSAPRFDTLLAGPLRQHVSNLNRALFGRQFTCLVLVAAPMGLGGIGVTAPQELDKPAIGAHELFEVGLGHASGSADRYLDRAHRDLMKHAGDDAQRRVADRQSCGGNARSLRRPPARRRGAE